MSIQRIKAPADTATDMYSTSMRWRKGRRNALGDIRDGLSNADIEELKSRVIVRKTDTSRLFDTDISADIEELKSRVIVQKTDTSRLFDTNISDADALETDSDDTARWPVRPIHSSVDTIDIHRNTSTYLHRRNAVPDILAILDEGSLCRIRSHRRALFNDPA